MASLFFANDGGSSTMVSKLAALVHRVAQEVEGVGGDHLDVLEAVAAGVLRAAAPQACSEISTAVTCVARVASCSAKPPT